MTQTSVSVSQPTPRRSVRAVDPVLFNVSRTSLARRVLNIVIDELGWESCTDPEYMDVDFHWVEPSTQAWLRQTAFKRGLIESHHRVNVFPAIASCTAKISLLKLLQRMDYLRPDHYAFMPESYILPDDAHLLAEVLDESLDEPSGRCMTMIVKPDKGSQGTGIFLVQCSEDLDMLDDGVRAVAQEYLERPLLIDGLKFDLRVYVLLVSVAPLRAYICREGLARFATEPYERPNESNLDRLYMHLTNSSVNKRSADFFISNDSVSVGSKRTMSSVFGHLQTKGYDIDELWLSINGVVTKTLTALSLPLANQYRAAFGTFDERAQNSRCFQVLGFDILLERVGSSRDNSRRLVPWLLEINSHPSMGLVHERRGRTGQTRNEVTLVDETIKATALGDALRIVRRLQERHIRHMHAQFGSDIELRSWPEQERSERSAPRYPIDPELGIELGSYTPIVTAGYRDEIAYLHEVRVLFEQFAGVRDESKSSMTAIRFVTFARRCGLIQSPGLTQSDLDLLFRQIIRRSVGGPVSGVALTQAAMSVVDFLDALLIIAGRRFARRGAPEDNMAALKALLDYVRPRAGTPRAETE